MQRHPGDLWRPRAHPRGYVAGAFGGLIGTMLGSLVGGLTALRATDPVGGAEVVLGPVVFGLLGGLWGGCVLGCYLALRIRRFPGAGRTALLSGVVLAPALVGVWYGTPLVPLWALVVAVSVGSVLAGRAVAGAEGPDRPA